MGNISKIVPENFILDVDGTLTDGGSYYDKNGKCLKKFGQHDTVALKRLKELTYINIEFVTSDFNYPGADINQLRCEDMGFTCHYHSDTFGRLKRMGRMYNLDKTIYMGDSLPDYQIMEKVFYSITPHNAFKAVRDVADYVTLHESGSGAVAEACLVIFEKFFLDLNIYENSYDKVIDLFTGAEINEKFRNIIKG